jgi:hypothetical protein
MKWLSKVVKLLGRVLGIASNAADVVEAGEAVIHEVEDLTRTEPSGRQLSMADVRRQQQQIASATSFKVPPKR